MRLLSKAQVLDLVPYSYTHIARLEEDGRFPKRVKHLGYARKNTDYCKAFWVEQEVLDWIQALVDARDAPTDTPAGLVVLITPHGS